jgi:hypothetical protein
MHHKDTNPIVKTARTSRAKRRHEQRSAKPSSGVSQRHTEGGAPPAASSAVFRSRARLPKNYGKVLGKIKERTQQEQRHASTLVNSAMLMLHWQVGRMLLEQLENAGWSKSVVARLSSDLRAEFPGMRAFSPRNLKHMCAFAAAWPNPRIVQGPLARFTWDQNIALLERLGSGRSDEGEQP